MAIRDLFVRLGFGTEGVEKIDKADRALKNAKESALNLGDAVKALGILWVARSVVNGVRDFISGSIQQADALKHQAEALGLTTEQLQKYQYAAGLVGVTTQQAAVGLRFWDRVVGEAEFGTKQAVKTFQRLGISLTDAGGKVKPTNELLFEFSDHLKALPDQNQRVALAMRTLGRNGAALLPFLQKGSAALKEMFADVEMLGGGFDEAFIEQAHELDVQQKRLAMGWRSMGVELLKVLMPAMRAWVDNGIRTVRMLIDMSRHTYVAKTALEALGVIAVGIGFAIAAAWLPEIAIFAAVTAAVLGAYLVFDDFYTFLKGGQSVLGDTLDSMGVDSKSVAGQIKEAMDSVAKALESVVKGFTDTKNGFAAAFIDSIPAMIKWGGVFASNILGALDMAITGFAQAGHLLAGVLGAVTGGGLGALTEGFDKAQQSGKDFEGRVKAYQQLRDAFQAIPTGGPTAGAGGLSQAEIAKRNDALAGGDSDARFMQSHPGWQKDTKGNWMQSGTGSTTNNVTVHVDASNAKDPKAVGSAVADGVKRGIKDAASTNRDTFNSVSQVSPVGVGG